MDRLGGGLGSFDPPGEALLKDKIGRPLVLEVLTLRAVRAQLSWLRSNAPFHPPQRHVQRSQDPGLPAELAPKKSSQPSVREQVHFDTAPRRPQTLSCEVPIPPAPE
jgi:hypothetical protein